MYNLYFIPDVSIILKDNFQVQVTPFYREKLKGVICFDSRFKSIESCANLWCRLFTE